MHRRTFTLSLAALLAACGKSEDAKPPVSAVPAGEPETPLKPVQDALGLRDALEQTRLSAGMPALAGAIVQLDGEIIAATGTREARGQVPVKLDDPWQIGSNAEAMTAALFARLVETGKLTWDNVLPQLLPDLKLDPAFASITMDQVMTHTAGLSDVGADWLIARRADKRPLPEQRLDALRKALAGSPQSRPGQASPANLDYLIAGIVIEHAVRKSWEDGLAEHVFKPLSMTHAAFGPPAGDAPLGHRSDSTGRLIPVPPGSDLDAPPALAPSTGMNLPLADWAKFIRVFLDPKQRFLSADSIRHLTTPAPGADQALGWRVIDLVGLGRGLQNSASNTLWCSSALLSPERQTAILLASNCATKGAQTAIGKLSTRLLRASSAN